MRRSRLSRGLIPGRGATIISATVVAVRIGAGEIAGEGVALAEGVVIGGPPAAAGVVRVASPHDVLSNPAMDRTRLSVAIDQETIHFIANPPLA